MKEQISALFQSGSFVGGQWLSGDNTFAVYDKATGDIVWKTELPAGTIAPPVTYMFEGKQYLLVSSGDVDTPGRLMAFALP